MKTIFVEKYSDEKDLMVITFGFLIYDMRF